MKVFIMGLKFGGVRGTLENARISLAVIGSIVVW
jgi:hypothetical protein